MKVALGLKAHSGWAALVAVAAGPKGPEVIDRRRIELVEEAWAKQPYHAAQELSASEARATVRRGIESARRIAQRELKAAVARATRAEHEVVGCAVIAGAPMPAWTIEEILAVHFRMHKAEGVLFRDALVQGAVACGLRVVAVPEKGLRIPADVAALSRAVGAPWGRDQKEAATAALAALNAR